MPNIYEYVSLSGSKEQPDAQLLLACSCLPNRVHLLAISHSSFSDLVYPPTTPLFKSLTPAHLDCLLFCRRSHAPPRSGPLSMWFPLLEMISLSPAYLWNPIHLCVYVCNNHLLMLMNSVSQKCRQGTEDMTYLHSTMSGTSVRKT